MSITFLTLKERFQTLIGDSDGTYADKYEDAINNSARELYPALHKPLIDETLITGNSLPNAHFEDWSQTTYPDHWNVSEVTALEETTICRGGVSSAKVTRADSDGYLYCSQTEWIDLLDLMDTQVSFKCWALASTASQAYIEIYTKQADGTEQTETSDAHSGGGEWELLEIEDFELNDDLTDIQFRCKVITTNGSVYFDNARVTGKGLYQLLLPLDFQNGEVSQVWIQTSGYSDDACDDLKLGNYAEEFGWKIRDDGAYRYLRFPYTPTSKRKIKLIGYCPLENDLSSSTDPMSINDKYTQRLLTYAAYLLYQMQEGEPSSDDISRYERASLKWLARSEALKNKRMPKPTGVIHWSF
jgi:hypothetical protein